MDQTQLLQHFDTLLATPEAILRLRNFVLSLAIRGQLLPQKPTDDPAAKLAEQITALAKGIAKNQKLKLPTPEIAIAETDKSFHLPHGWAWVKLGDLCVKLGAGSTPLGGKRVYQNSGVRFLRSQNVWNDGLYLDDVALIAPAVHKDMNSTCVEPGDLLLNITGASIGRCAVVPDDFDEANVSQHVAIVRLIDKQLRRFVHLIIIAPEFQSRIMQVQVGVSREGLSMKNLKEFVIALPPLAEQRRIVAKVEELLALCDELEARLATAQAIATALLDAGLHQMLTRDTGRTRRKSIGAEDYFAQLVPALLRAAGGSLTLEKLNAAVALLFLPKVLTPLVASFEDSAEAHFKAFNQPINEGSFRAMLRMLTQNRVIAFNPGDPAVTLRLNESEAPPIAPIILKDAQYLGAVLNLVPTQTTVETATQLCPPSLKKELLAIA